MLNTKIGKLGLVSVVVLGLAVSKVAANETETQVSSDENSIRYSVSEVEDKQTVTTTKDQEEKKEPASTNQKTVNKEQSNETNEASVSKKTEEEKPAQKIAHWEGDYYIKNDGSMAKNEWVYDKTYQSWFYLKSDGRNARNEWQGNYYLKSGGYMAKNEWVYDNTYQSWFYLKSDGSYANQEWQKVDGKWYYLKKWGYMAKNEWQGNYYLTSSGAMATGELVLDGVRYIFSDSGELKEKKDLNSGWVNKDGSRYFFNRREEQIGTDQAKKIIDISEHNGHISDWKKVIDENGVDGVIVRLGKDYSFANYITNAFGQFDNYTPMQLAQYVATIANNGVRIAPHIVEGIYGNNDKGQLGDLIQQIQPTEMNKVKISESDLSLLHQGFYQVAHGTSGLTTGRAFSNGALVSISGKTGTAESYLANGQQATNTNAVAYAPSDNPQIAVAVVFPHNTNLTNGVGPSIARDIINLYQQHHPMN